MTIPGWQEALILGESRGSPCDVWDPQCSRDWEEAFPGWVAKINPLIKKEPLPNTQLPKKGDPVTDNKELSALEYEVGFEQALLLF